MKYVGAAPEAAADVVTRGFLASVSGLPSWAGSRTGSYDPDRCLYTPSGARLGKSRAVIAKAAAGAASARILCLGESTTAGRGASRATTSFPAWLQRALVASGTPAAGTGYVPAGFTDADTRWTFTGSWVGTPSSLNAVDGIGAAYSGATNPSTAIFTADVPGTVLYFDFDNNGAPFTYSIDGATPVTVTPAYTATVGSVTVTGLANTTHTVVFTCTAGYNAILFGAEIRQASGVSVTNLGQSGAETVYWTGSAYQNALNMAKRLAPALTFVNIAINDQADGVTAAAHKANLSSIVAAMQSVGSDVVLINPHQTSLGDSVAFMSGLYDVADSYGCALIDQRDRFGTYAQMNALGMHFDGYHLLSAGYELAAQSALSLVQGPTAVPTSGQVVLSADVTNNNATANTLADVTGLSFPVAPGTYRYRAFIPYTAAATTTGSRWLFSGPAFSRLTGRTTSSTGATGEGVTLVTASNVPSAASGSSGNVAGNVAVLEGVVLFTAAGTFQVRFASGVANSAIVAKAGAFLDWQKLA